MCEGSFNGVTGSFKGISMKSQEFQGYFKIVSKVFQGRLNCISRVFKVTLNGISGMFQRYFKGVSRTFQGRFKSVPRKFFFFQGRLKVVSLEILVGFKGI